MKIRAAIILDNLKISKWQLDALNLVDDLIDTKLILNCKNTKIKKNITKNFLYFIINFFSLRNHETKKSYFRPKATTVLSFNSNYEEHWQVIPDQTIKELKEKKIEIIIKFGMNLLKTEGYLSNYKIFSFHHGDPSKFRGRPAGFYEILNNKNKVGIVVQEISNNIDAGKIYAFAETKVLNFSYKQTALNFYSISKFLLRKAVMNWKKGHVVQIKTNGQKFSLPSNSQVLMFIFKTSVNLVKKLVLGIFYEKRWKIGIGLTDIRFDRSNTVSEDNLQEIPILKKYSFYADPFYSSNGSVVRFEGLNKKTGKGSILEVLVDSTLKQKVILSGNHYSYPFSFRKNNHEYIFPEVARHSAPYYYSARTGVVSKKIIPGLSGQRIVDGTLFKYKGFWYLFFGTKDGVKDNSLSVLRLWVSKNLEEDFKPHPSDPVSINPGFARMGGKLVSKDGSLFRFGQNNEGQYGGSLIILKIIELSPTSYKEIQCGEIKMKYGHGPHTIDFNPLQRAFVLDYYENKFSFFSGVRRVKAFLSK